MVAEVVKGKFAKPTCVATKFANANSASITFVKA